MADETMSPGQALAAAQAAREKMAGAADCPPSRSWAFALIFGGVIAVQAAPHPWNLAGDAALLLAAGGVALVDRARKGVWLNGYRAGATRKVTFALLAAFLVIYALALWLKLSHGVWWAPLAGGAAMAPVASLASRRWTRAYRREVEARL